MLDYDKAMLREYFDSPEFWDPENKSIPSHIDKLLGELEKEV